MDYNHHRPHSSLGYMTPATFAATCIGPDSATLRQPQCREDVSGTLSQQLVLKNGADHSRSIPAVYHLLKLVEFLGFDHFGTYRMEDSG